MIDQGLGAGWTLQLTPSLQVSSSLITVRQSDGRMESFTWVNGHWQGDPDSHLRLTQDGKAYTLVSDQGISERYDLQGRILSHTDLVNRTTTYRYNSAGQLDSVTGPFGHTLKLSYDADNHIATMTDPGGGVYRYDYDRAGNLVQVTYPDDTFKVYHYEDPDFPHALTGITDENGDRYARFAYNAAGQAILTEHAVTSNPQAQEHFDLSYDGPTQTTVTDAIGTVEVLTFSENLGVKHLLSRIQHTDQKGIERIYDDSNNLIRHTDPEGRTTAYSYNASHQRITVTEAAGTEEARTTKIAYLSPNIDLPVHIWQPSILPGKFRETQIEYNPDHTVQSITTRGYRPDGTPISRKTTLRYNAAGQVVQIDGPLTSVDDLTTFSYYECTTGGRCGQMASLTDAMGHTTTFDRYDAHGRIRQTTSPNGVVTTYEYDPRGRLLQITRTAPEGQTRITTFRYDAAGQLQQLTTPAGLTLNYSYDAAHDLRSIGDNQGNRIEYRYDAKGNRIEETIKDAGGNLVRTVHTTYDLRNHVQAVNQGGSVTQMIHNAIGGQISVTDPNENPPTRYLYDALQHLQQRIDALGNLTTYHYDPQDQITQVQTPNGLVTGYRYDDFGRLIEETSPDRGGSHYQYDSAGRLLVKTDANGVVSRYRYDALGRLVFIDYPGKDLDTTFQYDNCNHGIGRLCLLTDRHTRIEYQYDPWGNRTTITQTIGRSRYTTRYQYDLDNRIAAIEHPSGRQINFRRTVTGRIESIENRWNGNVKNLVSNIDYLPFGPIVSLTYGNGLEEQRSYDMAWRMVGQVIDSLIEARYQYDDAGNLMKINTRDGQSQDYQYDPLHRLIEESGPYGQRSYQYGPNGNRLGRLKIDLRRKQILTIKQDYFYAPDSQHLIRIDTQHHGRTHSINLSYDPAGNTLARNKQAFTWDERNRLKAYNGNNRLIAEYRYNALGQRIETIRHQDRTRTRHYHYDPAGHLIGITYYDRKGRLKRIQDFVWLQDLPVAQITTFYNKLGQEKDTQFVYLHTDHLGTPRLATDPDQTLVWRWDSDAFGQGQPDRDPDHNGRKVHIPLRFPGQVAAEGGMFYNYFRYYDPGTGRYITSDPIGINGGLNTYLYANGNPMLYTDPDGMATILFGGSASFQSGGAGASASLGIGQEFGTENSGRVCVEVQTCGRIGPGASAGATFFGEVGEGSFCPGNNASGGVFAEGGTGVFEGIEASHGTSGNSASTSFRSGIGGGGAIGSQACIKRTFCFP